MLGLQLHGEGVIKMYSLFKFFFKVFNRVIRVPKYEISWQDLKNMLNESNTVQQVVLWDGKYTFTDFSTIMKIIKYDIVKWHEYKSEVYDCDNFAMTFAGLVPFMYGINSVGIVVGRVIDDKGNIGYHAWNVFIAMKSDGKPMLYMYEPQAGMFTTYKAAKIGNWKYEPVIVIWS